VGAFLSADQVWTFVSAGRSRYSFAGSCLVHGLSLLGCDGVRGELVGALGAQFDETEESLVPLRLQFLDRARSDFGMDAVDVLPLPLVRQYRRADGLPPGRHRTAELLEEMLDAAGATAKVIEHHVAHDPPAQARAPGERGVDVGGAHDALGNEVINLTGQRPL